MTDIILQIKNVRGILKKALLDVTSEIGNTHDDCRCLLCEALPMELQAMIAECESSLADAKAGAVSGDK